MMLLVSTNEVCRREDRRSNRIPRIVISASGWLVDGVAIY